MIGDSSASLVLPAYCPDQVALQTLDTHLRGLPYQLVPCASLPVFGPVLRGRGIAVAMLERNAGVNDFDKFLGPIISENPRVLIGTGGYDELSRGRGPAFPRNVWSFKPTSRTEIREGLRRSWVLRAAGDLRQSVDATPNLPKVLRLALHALLNSPSPWEAERAVGFTQSKICDYAELPRTSLSRLTSNQEGGFNRIIDGWRLVEASAYAELEARGWYAAARHVGYESTSGLHSLAKRVCGDSLKELEGRHLCRVLGELSQDLEAFLRACVQTA